jgi:hypothetical protein
MRTAKEIASDYVAANMRLQMLQASNVANRTPDDLVKLEAAVLETRRDLARLRREMHSFEEET